MGDSTGREKRSLFQQTRSYCGKIIIAKQKHSTIHGKLYIANKLPDRALYT